LLRRDIGYLIVHSLKEWNIDKIHGNIKKKFDISMNLVYESRLGNFVQNKEIFGKSNWMKVEALYLNCSFFIKRWLRKIVLDYSKDLREFNTGFSDITQIANYECNKFNSI